MTVLSHNVSISSYTTHEASSKDRCAYGLLSHLPSLQKAHELTRIVSSLSPSYSLTNERWHDRLRCARMFLKDDLVRKEFFQGESPRRVLFLRYYPLQVRLANLQRSLCRSLSLSLSFHINVFYYTYFLLFSFAVNIFCVLILSFSQHGILYSILPTTCQGIINNQSISLSVSLSLSLFAIFFFCILFFSLSWPIFFSYFASRCEISKEEKITTYLEPLSLP